MLGVFRSPPPSDRLLIIIIIISMIKETDFRNHRSPYNSADFKASRSSIKIFINKDGDRDPRAGEKEFRDPIIVAIVFPLPASDRSLMCSRGEEE